MIKNFKYLSAMKMGNIPPDVGEKICTMLTKPTLDRLTAVGMDRRLISPILEMADKMSGINDENINRILDDYNAIAALMNKYCK